MTLSDNIDYIYNNDDTEYQSNCQYSFYSKESKYINYKCNFNDNSEFTNGYIQKKFNAKKIYVFLYMLIGG